MLTWWLYHYGTFKQNLTIKDGNCESDVPHCFGSHIWKRHLGTLTSPAPWILPSAMLQHAYTRGVFTCNSTIFITSITPSNQYFLMLQLALDSILSPKFMWPSGTKTTFIIPKFHYCFTVPNHDFPSLQAEIPLSNYSLHYILNSIATVCLHPIYLPQPQNHLIATLFLHSIFTCITPDNVPILRQQKQNPTLMENCGTHKHANSPHCRFINTSSFPKCCHSNHSVFSQPTNSRFTPPLLYSNF